ncbi:DUF1761 domain-containing protein [Hyphomonas sp. FCG-A18]|uniref:DUF1761 domain-containing protein n=1 Tax=Hyphomonas sp. FCG-A18 TaxID=3080019 RepID=UPI002B2D41A7|nr:DUF1761 domain-containing protein [Hyphomonas sp. FCG-A18]
MPRLSGVNLVGVLLAALVMWILGFVWYGVLFSEAWMAGNGYTEAMFEGQSGLWMAAGFLIPLILAFGLGWHMKQKSITKLNTAVLFALWLALLIGVPLMMYNYVYSPHHSWQVLLIDGSHTVATFVAGAAVLSFFD